MKINRFGAVEERHIIGGGPVALPESLGANGSHAATAIASFYRGHVAHIIFQTSLKTAGLLPQGYLEKSMMKGSSMQGKAELNAEQTQSLIRGAGLNWSQMAFVSRAFRAFGKVQLLAPLRRVTFANFCELGA